MWTAFAEVTGTVHVDDVLYIREGAGTGYKAIGQLHNGDVVTLLQEVKDAGGASWYRLKAGSVEGYSSAQYITINTIYQPEQNFEQYLNTQGFPESYKPALRQLHAQHPQWVFRTQGLSMTWADALAAESKVGKNTIQNPEAWRSVEYGAYDWEKKTYVSFDSGGWVAAAASVVAYYMDPRNFLDATYIFQFEQLSYSDTQNEAGVKAILPTALQKHAADVLRAAKESKVSAYFLATRIRQEGTASNGLGTGTYKGYEGYYNFFDYGAYAANGRSAVENGAIYAKNHGWNTPYKCLLDSANMIGKSYILLGQNTIYFQKFNLVNTASGLYSHQYMSNVAAAASEGSIRARSADAAQLNTNLVFSIPVFKDMPQTAAPKPSTVGNNDNTLTALAVSGCPLTPSFNRYTTSYAAQVAQEVETVTVSAVKSRSDASVSGGGQVHLAVGLNAIPVTVTSSSGAKRVYTVYITREGDATNTYVPAVTGGNLTIGKTVTGMEPGTKVEDLLNALKVADNGFAALCHASGEAKTTGTVATGDILQVYSADKVMRAGFPVVIYGDIGGDGQVTSMDLRIAQKHILGASALSGYYLTAADAGKDGKVTSVDLRIIQKYILRVTTTLQQ